VLLNHFMIKIEDNEKTQSCRLTTIKVLCYYAVKLEILEIINIQN